MPDLKNKILDVLKSKESSFDADNPSYSFTRAQIFEYLPGCDHDEIIDALNKMKEVQVTEKGYKLKKVQ